LASQLYDIIECNNQQLEGVDVLVVNEWLQQHPAKLAIASRAK
jgi:hypothetical protein